jgi:CheY-like chemotaxis protein
VREIRSCDHADLASTPAVAVTDWTRERDRTEAITAGFQVHLSKPVPVMTLVAVVSALASTHRT